MVITTLMLKSNKLPPLKALKQGQIRFDASLPCIKHSSFRPNSHFSGVQLKSNIITTSTSTSKRPNANLPSDLKASAFLNPPVPQDNVANNAVKKTLEWLGIPLLVVALSLLLTLSMYSRQSALASSISQWTDYGDLLSRLTKLCLYVVVSLFFLISEICIDAVGSSGNPSKLLKGIIISLHAIWMLGAPFMSPPQTTINLQVGLYVKGRSLQINLNQIAKVIDDDSSDWKFILQETTNSLFRSRTHWISAYSYSNLWRSYEDANEHFNILSSEEYRKNAVRALVNFEDTDRQSIVSQELDQYTYTCTYIVLTIFGEVSVLLSIFPIDKLPTITNRGDVEEALKMLKFVSGECNVKRVNISWTSGEENDILSLEEGVPRNYLHPPKYSYNY